MMLSIPFFRFFPKIFGPSEDMPLDHDGSLAAFRKLTEEVRSIDPHLCKNKCLPKLCKMHWKLQSWAVDLSQPCCNCCSCSLCTFCCLPLELQTGACMQAIVVVVVVVVVVVILATKCFTLGLATTLPIFSLSFLKSAKIRFYVRVI